MKIRTSVGEKLFQIFNYFVLTLLILMCAYPIWYVLVASVSDSNALMSYTGLLLKPLDFTWSAYEKVIENPMIIRGYANTLFILVIGVILDMILTSMGAYFLSRKQVLFKKPIMIFIVLTMYLEGGIIPFYLNLKDLHLTGTLWGLILPFMIKTQNLIILRTAFASIPESLIEAARIDGAGHITVLMKIVLPLSKAMLAVIVLYYGVEIWNSWFWASAILRDREMYPLQVVLREILLQNDMSSMAIGGDTGSQDAVSQSIRYATIVVATVPILCVYPFLQKHFTKGTLAGAVKE